MVVSFFCFLKGPSVFNKIPKNRLVDMKTMLLIYCFLAFQFPGRGDEISDRIVRADLKKIFPEKIFFFLRVDYCRENIVPEIDGEITCFCSWETYGGAILVYDRDLSLTTALKPGKIREARAEDLDFDGISEIIARCGPWSATGYTLKTVNVFKWDGGKLHEYGRYKEFEGVYMRTIYISFEISRELEDILLYIRETCSEEGIEFLRPDILMERDEDHEKENLP